MSVNAVMVLVFAIAVDSMVFRSIRARPWAHLRTFGVILLGTLPMANLLAVDLMSVVRRRGVARPFRLGFVLGGTIAGVVAIAALSLFLGSSWTNPHLFSLWRSLTRERVSPPNLLLIFLAFQSLVAAVAGFLGRKLLATKKMVAEDGPSRKAQLGGLLTMLALIAIPAILTETILRWRVDPMNVRYGAGTEAALDVRVYDAWTVTLRDDSRARIPNGTRIRVEEDNQPPSFGGMTSPKAAQFGDSRNVRVILLQGEWAGESTSVPRYLLRSIR
ncbi:MAG: hypothetical protein P4L85_18855 [Paludisphaera borealis]|uniref:hypothetical protein n=1 Tax=Paludisphaera borealis TaxID=1387353 RepID=UPI00284F5C53|nr:hypothetical protein [Paludisphaera borealis]MDR3621417.1 hypothetical protein [Paludisphaera borealis]